MTTETPTLPVSEATHELIQLCNAVKDGAEERLPELDEKVKERRQQLSTAWEYFGSTVEAESPEFIEPRQPIIEAVESQFQAYSQALDKIDAYLKDKQPALLEEAVPELVQASAGLFFAQTALETSALAAGSSRFPIVNTFENLFKILSAGKLPMERWHGACHGHRQFYEGALKEIEASPAAQDAGVPERKAAIIRIIAILDELDAMTSATPRGEFDARMQGLTQAHVDLEAAFQTFNYNTFAKGPTKSTEANQVIYAALQFKEGKFPVHVLRGQVDQMLEHVRKSRADVQAATRLPAESPLVVEEIPNVLEAIEAMEDALETLKGLETPSDAIDTTLTQFQEAVERLTRSNEILKQHNQTFGKMVCPHCQALNQAAARTCEKCHGVLPQFTGSEVYGSWSTSSFQVGEGETATGTRGPVVTRSMQALADSCAAYEKGEMSQEDFLKVLETNRENVQRAETRLASLEMPPVPEEATEEERAKCEEFLAFAGDTIGLLSQGVAQCTAGLEKLEKYALEDKTTDLQEGLREFFEGCNRMLQIEEVAKNFVAALPPKVETEEQAAPPQEEGTPAPAAPPAEQDGTLA